MGRAFEYRKASKLKRWGHMAKTFTRIGKQIAIAVKAGGPEPENNPSLRAIIATAKRENMPKDNIERAIKNAMGKDQSDYKTMTYEGYGPNGIAIIVDALTDNRNRTSADVRAAFSKGQGNVGTPGCVSFMFDKKGQIIIDKEECDMDADDLMMEALDDFQEEDDSYVIMTDPDAFSEVREALEAKNIPMASAEVTMIPQNYVALTDETALKNLNRILDLLDESDDVQAVYTNLEED